MLKNNRLILNGVLVFSIISLSIAYFIQFVLGHKPCNLCLIERIPYLASVILISLIFIINRFKTFIAGAILLFFVFGRHIWNIIGVSGFVSVLAGFILFVSSFSTAELKTRNQYLGKSYTTKLKTKKEFFGKNFVDYQMEKQALTQQ